MKRSAAWHRSCTTIVHGNKERERSRDRERETGREAADLIFLLMATEIDRSRPSGW
jgi:hypothetical protein